MSAVLSLDGAYRYRLDREVGRSLEIGSLPDRRVLWVMLNPSKADATEDDATIRRCVGFTERFDAAALTVVNLYARRSTDPEILLSEPDPPRVERWNDAAIIKAAEGAAFAVVAWGDHPAAAPRARRVFSLVSGRVNDGVFCLGRCASGAPRHPVRLPYAVALQPWSPA